MLLLTPTTTSNSGLQTTAERIAEIYIANHQEGYVTHRADLLKAGFSEDEITAHDPAAQRIAKKAITRQVSEDTAPAYDRVGRVQNGAALIGGLQPSAQAIYDCLANNGYKAPEIGTLWPEIIAVAGDRFAALQRVS